MELRILANINSKSGSNYHRLMEPLTKLGASFSEELNTELVKNYDVIFIQRNCKISVQTLGIWQQMGKKIVFDLDDSFKIPLNYPNAKTHLSGNETVKNKIRQSDWVIVSTEELRQEILGLNEKITVIPNRINYDSFPIKKETKEEFMSRKIRVGFVGAYTHYQDFKSIIGWLNSLVRNSLFMNNCEFVMGGYTESSKEYWKEFANLGKFIHAMPPEKYLRIFYEFDIILVPLLDNDFNKCKSSLRLLEGAVGNCVCLLDKQYALKSDVPKELTDLYIYKDKEWFSKVIELISDREKLWKLKQSNKEIRKLDFSEVVDKRKKIIEEVVKIPIEPIKYSIYSIKYREDQPVEYNELYNKVKTIEEGSYLFEHRLIKNIVPNLGTNDWIGIFSWKFPLKTGVTKKMLNKILDNNKRYDCINFCKPLDDPYLKFTEKQHPGFMELFALVCNDLDLSFSEPKNTIYAGQFVLKGELYREYVREVLVPAIDLIENKYKDLAWKDAKYKGGLPKDKLKEYTGLDYYPMLVFVLERLVGQWIDKNKFKVLNYWK